MEYLVVRCPRCGMPSAVKADANTHQCPYCGFRFMVGKSVVLARASNGREASELVRRFLAGKKGLGGIRRLG